MLRSIRFPALIVAVLAALPACAEVKPHGLFTDGCVLQQGMPVPVWGMAKAGEKVMVRLGSQSQSTTAASNGTWMVKLKPLKAGGPVTLTIAGENTVEIKNVLVGEVWICSGQSNMQWDLRQTTGADAAIAASADPMLHLLTVPRHAVDQPEHDVNAPWVEAKPETVPGFSAVAYYFGRDLRKARKVPIGLISTNVGGTPAEAWTRRMVLWNDADLKKILVAYADRMAAYEKQDLENRMTVVRTAARREAAPIRPANSPSNMQRPCGLYNGMIAPLIPFAIRGAIWYQGESNAGRAYEYRKLIATMIQNWRQDWGEPDMTFLQVQLAPYTKIVEEPGDSNWAELREAQLMATKSLLKSGMAVITDVGEENDIHPKKKEPVGARLALAARAITYGEKIEYSGPAYESMTVEGNKAILRFKHAHGMKAADGSVKGFTIAGSDRKFYNAKAEVKGDRVTVWADQVSTPVSVRYGWANFPVVNLENDSGLYASPFRTDDWPITTGPK